MRSAQACRPSARRRCHRRLAGQLAGHFLTEGQGLARRTACRTAACSFSGTSSAFHGWASSRGCQQPFNQKAKPLMNTHTMTLQKLSWLRWCPFPILFLFGPYLAHANQHSHHWKGAPCDRTGLALTWLVRLLGS